MLIIVSGIISVGGKNIIVNVFERKFGGGEKTYVDTDEIALNTELTEEEAYARVEEAFGTKVVRIEYKPKNTKFLEIALNEELQEVTLYYLIDDKVLSFRIEFPYSNSSSGMEIQDELAEEYILELTNANVKISKFKIQDTKELEYEACFTYKNSKYFLTGVMKQEEFEKIVKNLNFF